MTTPPDPEVVDVAAWRITRLEVAVGLLIDQLISRRGAHRHDLATQEHGRIVLVSIADALAGERREYAVPSRANVETRTT